MLPGSVVLVVTSCNELLRTPFAPCQIGGRLEMERASAVGGSLQRVEVYSVGRWLHAVAQTARIHIGHVIARR